MGELKAIRFEEELPEVKDRVKNYWTTRADSFFQQRWNELNSSKSEIWTRELLNYLRQQGDETKLKILDVGCGTGYFEILLGKLGYEITGIDLTEQMVFRANQMIEQWGLDSEKVRAIKMDAENLSFGDASFDVVITRNLTWTLPHPSDAYKEWYRVLKKGGILLNFDAEYAKNAHVLRSEENNAHQQISRELKEECHKIYHMLAVSALDRPGWDCTVLKEIGFSGVKCDLDFYRRVFAERDEFYIPDKMFLIYGCK